MDVLGVEVIVWLACTGFKGIGDCTGRVEATGACTSGDTGACTGGDKTWYLGSISDGDIFGCEQGKLPYHHQYKLP